MSHATCLIIGASTEEEVEQAMYPYWELDLSRAEMKKDPRAVFVPKIAVIDLEKEFKKFLEDEKNKKYLQEKNISYTSPLHWIKEWYNYYLNSEKTHYGYYHNPKAKWDWYKIGGRWAGFFILKPDVVLVGQEDKKSLTRKSWTNENEFIAPNRVDVTRMGDIDWEVMRQNLFEKACESWKKRQENIEQTKEEYLKHYCHPHTFAVIKNGEWFEKGEMGFWAIVKDKKENKEWEDIFDELMLDVDSETWLTLVDYHI